MRAGDGQGGRMSGVSQWNAIGSEVECKGLYR
jgi:hypothetical protein